MFLLDTDICIYLMKNKYPNLQKRVEQESPFNIGISAISVAEFEFGISKSMFPEKNRLTLIKFLAPFQIVPFTAIDGETFGKIRTYLNKKGTPIGPYDLQIAAQCLSRELILITNNVREFKRIPNLKFMNWIKEVSSSI